MITAHCGFDTFGKHFPELYSNESIEITFHFSDTREVCYCEKTHKVTGEKYILNVRSDDNKHLITVACSGDKSAFYALCDINERIKEKTLSDGEYVCAPSFKVRGYIEGFYGTPWNHENRLLVMECMAKHRMNTVYYAPKDDEYHRDKWRELYPQEDLCRLKELSDAARAYYMDFYWCIAPGLSVKYSSSEEFEILMKKTMQVCSVGIKNFGLLLDDIAEDLVYPEDKEAYKETVNAHIDLINRYYDALKEMVPDAKLTVCPMLYNGKGDEYYISKLGKSISPFISVFWTGRDVCSRDLTSYEALKFIEGTDHKPLYWDNYPVNDGSMFNEMHLSPIINRDKDLWKYSEGIISNCMEYALCSQIPLITFADYLWDSENYDSEKSYEKAIRQVIGEEKAEIFTVFADHLYTSCLKDKNSRRMMKLFDDVEKAFSAGDLGKALMLAAEYIEKMNACRDFLNENIPICKELSKWAEKFSVACDIINTLMNFITEYEESILEEIYALIDKYDAMPARLTSDMNLREELGNLMNINLF